MIEQKAEECREPEAKSCSVQTEECGDKCSSCRRERQERAEERCLLWIVLQFIFDSFYPDAGLVPYALEFSLMGVSWSCTWSMVMDPLKLKS